jgi:hypothetical protein
MLIAIDSIVQSGVAPDITYTVTVHRTDTGTRMQFGYHRSQFVGLTKPQIRALVIADIKANLNPVQPDNSSVAGFVPGEIVDLGA